MADVKKIATREGYSDTLVELAGEIPNLYVFDADLAGATKTSKEGQEGLSRQIF